MTKQLSVRLNSDIYQDLSIEANQESRSVNNLITWVLTNFIEQKKCEEPVKIVKEETAQV